MDLILARFRGLQIPPSGRVVDAFKKRRRAQIEASFEWEEEDNVITGALAEIVRSVEIENADVGSSFKPYRQSPMYKNGLRLRSYQLEGVNWLLQNWHSGRGSILADEMGLGKTAQSIAFFEHLRVREVRGPFLAVVPLSTIGHWRREIERWTDMNVCVYYDQATTAAGNSADGRSVIRQYEWEIPNRPCATQRQLPSFMSLSPTYETVVSDLTYLNSFTWKAMIVDEGQRLKNYKSKISEVLREQLHCDHRIILTGTPIQNDIRELWALLSFVQRGSFGTLHQFESEYGDLHSGDQVLRLRNLMEPYILRRLKGEVEKQIPPKIETIVDVELTTLQKQYYRAIFERNREFLYHGCSGNMPSLMNVEMQLRKCCNHPFSCLEWRKMSSRG